MTGKETFSRHELACQYAARVERLGNDPEKDDFADEIDTSRQVHDYLLDDEPAKWLFGNGGEDVFDNNPGLVLALD